MRNVPKTPNHFGQACILQVDTHLAKRDPNMFVISLPFDWTPSTRKRKTILYPLALLYMRLRWYGGRDSVFRPERTLCGYGSVGCSAEMIVDSYDTDLAAYYFIVMCIYIYMYKTKKGMWKSLEASVSYARSVSLVGCWEHAKRHFGIDMIHYIELVFSGKLHIEKYIPTFMDASWTRKKQVLRKRWLSNKW